MRSIYRPYWIVLLSSFFCLSLASLFETALGLSVSKEVENEYRQKFENRAMFLKIPIRGDSQVIHIRGRVAVADQTNRGAPLSFKVGDQVRITRLDFKDRQVEFQLSSIDLSQRADLIFDFGESLSYTFHQRSSFDDAVRDSLTEGITYREIESAKENFVKSEFSRIVNQFAETTGTEAEFVVEAFLEATPEYSRIQDQLRQLKGQVGELETSLTDERSVRRKLEIDVRETKTNLGETTRLNESLSREKKELSAERDRLAREVADLRKSNQQFQLQISSVAAKLNTQVDSNSQLGKQIEALSLNIDSLNRERTRLTARVGELDEELTQTQKERDRVSGDLNAAKRRISELQGDLNSLTSNRESLEATYLRTKEAKENLELASRIAGAISLKRARPLHDDRPREVSEVYLLTQHIADLEVTSPESSGDFATLVFSTRSPDTVQFSEEERELYESLGDRLKIEPQWTSFSGHLHPVLESGENIQSVAPREKGEWRWRFEGSLAEADMVSLDVRLYDQNESPVRVAEFQFGVQPDGLLSGIGSSLSPLSLVLGVIAGGIAVGVIGALRSRPPRARHRRSKVNREYRSEKQL